MKKVLLIIAVLGLLAPPFAAAQRWSAAYGPLLQVQGKKGEQGGGRDGRGGREARPPQRDQRDERHQGRMTDEERRGLHKDLDRANREIYKPAPRR